MNARQWLGRCRGIEKEIRTLERAEQETRLQLERITQNYAAEPVGGTKDPHKYDRLAEYANMLQRKRIELVEVKAEVTAAIYEITDGRLRNVLMSYYINCQSLEQIAADANYSYRHVKRLRRFGEIEIENNMAHIVP